VSEKSHALAGLADVGFEAQGQSRVGLERADASTAARDDGLRGRSLPRRRDSKATSRADRDRDYYGNMMRKTRMGHRGD
jgi:hypothetical protein